MYLHFVSAEGTVPKSQVGVLEMVYIGSMHSRKSGFKLLLRRKCKLLSVIIARQMKNVLQFATGRPSGGKEKSLKIVQGRAGLYYANMFTPSTQTKPGRQRILDGWKGWLSLYITVLIKRDV